MVRVTRKRPEHDVLSSSASLNLFTSQKTALLSHQQTYVWYLIILTFWRIYAERAQFLEDQITELCSMSDVFCMHVQACLYRINRHW